MSSSSSSTAGPRESPRYEIIAKLGHGGMARVYLVLARGHAGVSKLLVRKELLPDLHDDPEFLSMFLSEARVTVRLNHPNVVQTYEVHSEGDRPSIVMEYLEGQTHAAVLNRVGRENFPLSLHLYVLSEVLAGLHHAHELTDFDGSPLEVVHRDVSPQNVFITYDGQVKLVDFGIAKTVISTRTKTGVFKGKASYAAPEQILCADIDRRTDVFAVGAMLWEALAGRRIGPLQPEVALAQRRLAGAEPKIETVVPDVRPEIARICDKAMAREPAERYATAEQMREELNAYLETTKTRGARELGLLMQKHFTEDRANIHRQIDARIKEINQAEGASSSSGAILIDVDTDEPSELQSLGRDVSAARQVLAPSSPSGHAPTSRPLLLALGGGAVVLLGVALAIALRRPSDRPTAALTTAATASASPAPEGGQVEVDVEVSVSPPEARLFLDDVAATSNPLHISAPKGTKAHVVRASAAGYVAEERILVFDRDLRVHLELKAATTATAEARQAPLPPPSPVRPPVFLGRTPSLPATHEPSPRAAPPPTTTTTQAPASPTPGDALVPAPRKKQRSIDETL